MNPQQDTKKLIVTSPAAIVDAGSWTTNEIDTLGYDYCVIDVLIGPTDVAMAALKVQETDVSATGLTDVVGLDTDGDTDIDGNLAVLPSATDDDMIVTFEIDLRNRKRYLDLLATAGDGVAGTFLSAIATLSRAKLAPTTTSERGAETILRA